MLLHAIKLMELPQALLIICLDFFNLVLTKLNFDFTKGNLFLILYRIKIIYTY
jgi:hypothetical protein